MNAHNNPNIDEPREFYDRVYLCTQTVTGIDCKRFKSFEEADSYKNNTHKTKETSETNLIFPTLNLASTMIPMCKYTPIIFDKPILKFKLANTMNVKLSKSDELDKN